MPSPTAPLPEDLKGLSGIDMTLIALLRGGS